MLLIKTYLKESGIHGVGCFAKEKVLKGTAIWRFLKGFDLALTEEFIGSISEGCREQILKYSYKSPYSQNYILCSDDARFFNHSNNNNVINIKVEGFEEGLDIAQRDIFAGEELTYDYRTFKEDSLF